ncbi:helix-turn-helix domain-containing protein [Nocardioides soli]|uniref:Excisionase family DNA binding protein n=1 Tax=Nocardioides soli TaxID=1036020 RepID=A0A7W4Z1V2_9ACTN|nr:helix-turn-helix domain-containing protein [Nocardioides soli]MBB3041975.1 excisionase family DNA binding protein [Nocardioides soli]
MEKTEQPYGYRIEEAAQRLGIGRSLMFDLVRRGDVRTVRFGRRRVVPSDEIARLLSGSETDQ